MDMLSRMDAEREREREIDQQFMPCLRQALWAKNSLSRFKGFTPEQAVCRNIARLPASAVAAPGSMAHI